VDSRGLVTDVTIIEDVAPFTEVVEKSVIRWSFGAAREGNQRVDSHVLVAGLFRPPTLAFARPEIPEALEAEPSEDVPFPTSIAIPPYPANRIGSAYVLVEGKVSESGSVSEARVMTPTSGFDDAALSSLRGWQFRPAKRDGRAAPASVYLVVFFRQPN
jgi:TonB family protein